MEIQIFVDEKQVIKFAWPYMEIVQQSDAATLFPIINAHVASGTVVYTDEWAILKTIRVLAKRIATQYGNMHFVDPITGTHTHKQRVILERMQ